MPSVPNFHFGTIQYQHGISAYLPPSIQYSLSASRTIQSGGSVIRPRASAPLPGESYGIFSPPPPNLSRAMPRMKTISSYESEPRPRGREKIWVRRWNLWHLSYLLNLTDFLPS